MTSYTGRFAPSPTGPLHMGSLLAAMASWCDARAHGGQWLLRIEDVDEVRTRPGAVDHIFSTLENCCLTWDGPVMVQSQRKERYQDVLNQLQKKGQVFWCSCTRSELARTSVISVYPGTCRCHLLPEPDCAARIRVTCPTAIPFNDRIFGEQAENPEQAVGDFVIRRRDGYFAYQLAVVTDDADQGVTHVVRGADLLDNTARQIYLQQSLGFSTPGYAHLPLIINPNGEKLSKQTGALAIDINQPTPSLWLCLDLLKQSPPPELKPASPGELLAWAVKHWDISAIPAQHFLAADRRIDVQAGY